MVYMGSKGRIAKHILRIMLYGRQPDQFWVEPFVGGGNVIDKVTGPRIGADINPYLIAFFNALKNGWLPPRDVSEEDYYTVRDNKELFPPYMLGYYGFALTFGASWFATYAKNSEGYRYDHAGFKAAQLQAQLIQGVQFQHSDYFDLYIPKNSIIYCDPPYKTKRGSYAPNYTGDGSTFDHDKFWHWCRGRALEGHKVYVSEYRAPDDFICLWERGVINNYSNEQSIERLFTYLPEV